MNVSANVSASLPEAKTPPTRNVLRGLLLMLIGAPGFEPGTSCSQSIGVGVSDTTTCSIYAVLRASSSYLTWGNIPDVA